MVASSKIDGKKKKNTGFLRPKSTTYQKMSKIAEGQAANPVNWLRTPHIYIYIIVLCYIVVDRWTSLEIVSDISISIYINVKMKTFEAYVLSNYPTDHYDFFF